MPARSGLISKNASEIGHWAESPATRRVDFACDAEREAIALTTGRSRQSRRRQIAPSHHGEENRLPDDRTSRMPRRGSRRPISRCAYDSVT